MSINLRVFRQRKRVIMQDEMQNDDVTTEEEAEDTDLDMEDDEEDEDEDEDDESSDM